MNYVSRAGDKLKYAIDNFLVDVSEKICADLGSSTGGFVDCLIQEKARKIYAIETGYGLLDWKLRNDSRVIVMEKTNALYVTLPELVDIVTIDTGWTKQEEVLKAAKKLLKPNGVILTLIKPSFELGKQYKKDSDSEIAIEDITQRFELLAKSLGYKVEGFAKSPILGAKGKNIEFVCLLSMVS